MSIASIKERLAAIKNDPANLPQEVRSESKLPSTLSTFLILYSKGYEVYDMIGEDNSTAYLLRWLTKPGVPLDFELDKFPQIDNPAYKIPKYLSSVRVQSLVKLIRGKVSLSDSATSLWDKDTRIERAIIITTAHLVAQGIL